MIIMNDCKINFSGAGLFLTDDIWLHPKRCETTYEIIYVVSGNVYICEENNHYHLKSGNLIILNPEKEHFGYKESTGRTSFHWLHFSASNFKNLPINKNFFCDFDKSYLFKEILHHHISKNTLRCETALSYLLSELFFDETTQIPKLCSDIRAWVHTNANASLSVKDVATHFGYNSEHISRLIKKSFGCSLKQLIDRDIIYIANNLLLNSNFCIKEISATLNFSTLNSFIHFYKYHEKISPSAYRNSYSNTKINKS